MKTIKVIGSVLVALIVLFIGFAFGFLSNILYFNKPKSDVLVSGDLSIHFLQLGNKYCGDCIYIKCGENDILVDAGSRRDSSTTIINYVDQFVTDNTLEYVFATHADQDHISAFVSTNDREGVLEHYKTGTIIDFPKTGKNTDILNRYRSAVEGEVSEGATHYTALQCYNNEGGASRTYQLSEYVELEILYNYYYENSSSDENNYSVCFMLNQGDNHYLFTGDLENEGEKKLVSYYEENFNGLPECILYKAGHHGSGTSSTNELLSVIKPKYVCICTCAGTSEYTDNNDNQFPYQTTVDKLAKYTDKVYVTSVVDNYVPKNKFGSEGTVKPMNGNIVFTSKNGQITVECSNNNLTLKETDWFKANRVCPDAWK